MEGVLNFLNQENITNIYIGVTGVLVAIVIFAAELIKEQNNELKKRVLLSITKIKGLIIYSLVIFGYMLLANIFRYDLNENANLFLNIVFLVIQSILVINVVILIVLTGKIFYVLVKLNTEKDYFNESLVKYIEDRSKKLEKKANKKGNKELKREKKEFKQFLKVYGIKNNTKSFEEDKYEAIYPLKNGRLKTFEYKKMNNIINEFEEKIIEKGEYIPTKEKILLFDCDIGENINVNKPICYCLKEFSEYFKNIQDCIIMINNSMYLNDEIEIISKGLFELALEYENPYYYDENMVLFNYLKFLYQNNLIAVKNIVINNVEECYRETYKKADSNKKFCKFLLSFSYLAFSYDDYEDYKYINNFIVYLYEYQILYTEESKDDIAYSFFSKVMNFNFYSVKKNKNVNYYDNLLSMLFRILIIFIKNSNYSAIKVLMRNFLYNTRIRFEEELNEYEIIDFQFCCGIIYAYIAISKQNINGLDENVGKEIKGLINYLKNRVIHIHYIQSAIKNFRKYFDRKTCIQECYKNFDFKFVEHKNRSIFSGLCITDKEILKEFIYLFDIKNLDNKEIDNSEINRLDKYYYSDLLRLVQSKNKTKLEEDLKIYYNNTNLVKYLNELIKEAEIKEKDYLKNNKVDSKIVEEVRRLIKENLIQGGDLFKFLKEKDKIKEKDIISNNVKGINQLFNREIFFEGSIIYKDLSQEIGNSLNFSIEKEYMKKIEENSKVKSENIDFILENLDYSKEYIIFTDFLSEKYIEKYNYNFENIEIKKKKIKVINRGDIEGIYILKIDDLPIIDFCKFNEDFNKNYIENNSLYYEFKDCSNNKFRLKEDLINKIKWQKNIISDKEKNEYLKEKCLIKALIAYEINVNENSKIIKIK